MKDDFNTLVQEAIKTWFRDEYPDGLVKASKGRQKYSKKYFDTIEGEYGEVTKVD